MAPMVQTKTTLSGHSGSVPGSFWPDSTSAQDRPIKFESDRMSSLTKRSVPCVFDRSAPLAKVLFDI